LEKFTAFVHKIQFDFAAAVVCGDC